MFIVTNFLSFLFIVWMCLKIWRVNAVLAIASFFIFPVAIIPLVQNWGDEENDIRVPFFLALACAAYSTYSFMSYFGPEEREGLLQVLQGFA